MRRSKKAKFTPEKVKRWKKWKPTPAERLGFHKAQVTRAARIKKECTPDRHEELSKTKRYCTLCNRAIYKVEKLTPMTPEQLTAFSTVMNQKRRT